MQHAAETLVRRHTYSVADFERMGEAGILPPEARVELVRGEVVDMAPIGSRHGGSVIFISEHLSEAVDRRAIIAVQNPLIVDEETYLEPDLSVLRRRQDYYRKTHPRPADVLLIVEVAETSLRYDREVKHPLYAQAGIPEVWLVDVMGGALAVCRHPVADRYRDIVELRSPGRLTPAALPDVAVDLSGLFG